MKIIAFLPLLYCTNISFCQTIELFGGANANVFYDHQNSGGHYYSSHDAGVGFTTGLAVNGRKSNWFSLRFLLQYDLYGGKLNASDGGLGGGYTTKATIHKSTISAGVFPINFEKNNVNLNFGVIISRLIHETYLGTNSGWLMGQPNWSYDLQEKYDRFSASTYVGIQGRFAYDIKASKSSWISLQYLYYIGLSNEFIEFPTTTKSMRHYFCIGVKKKVAWRKIQSNAPI